jgi:GT2 family glycosyltransferase
MSARPPVTLLMPNRNNERVLQLTLGRLAEHTTYPDFELIVVDDGSADRSVEILRRWRDGGSFRSFTLIEREHAGVVETLNAGLAAAAGDLVVQLDGDATVETAGWLEPMVEFFESDPLVGVVTPLVIHEAGEIHAAGVNILSPLGLHDRGSTPTEPVGERTLHTLVERPPPASLGALVTDPAEVDAAIGVHMLYSRDLAVELGGYDAGFAPVWFDDLDLALRIRRDAGMKAFYLPGVEVVHRTSLRGDRAPDTLGRRLNRGARAAVRSVLPQGAIDAVARVERRGTPHAPDELRRLAGHYAYWREKWGFDLLNPDLDDVQARYGDSELCWFYDAGRRAEGERVVAAWSARGGSPPDASSA